MVSPRYKSRVPATATETRNTATADTVSRTPALGALDGVVEAKAAEAKPEAEAEDEAPDMGEVGRMKLWLIAVLETEAGAKLTALEAADALVAALSRGKGSVRVFRAGTVEKIRFALRAGAEGKLTSWQPR